MLIRLFDIENDTVIPTEHCYTLKALKDIMEKFPDDHLKIYQYLFYMTCPSPDLNPFFHTPEIDKEPLIMQEIEDDDVWAALKFCQKMYETPTSRAYKGISAMLDRLGRYMETTPIEHGRDGNINSMVNAAAKFEQIRSSFKGAYKDLQEEQQSSVRGGYGLGYDQ